MNKKIIFVDIDGTILECDKGLDYPTLNTIYAFNKLKENGHLVFIASGRAKCLLSKCLFDLNPSGFILANGAYCEMDDDVLFEYVMDINTKKRIIDFANENEMAYYLETTKCIYTKDLNFSLHKKYTDTWKITECYRDKGYSDELPINIAMLALEEDEALVKKVNNELKDIVEIKRHGHLYSFDLNIKNVSKGSAIKKLIDILDISYDDTYAFGDGLNDIEMMNSVKYSVAMGNACDELKKHAKYITDDVMNDGFYKFLLRHHLID